MNENVKLSLDEMVLSLFKLIEDYVVQISTYKADPSFNFY